MKRHIKVLSVSMLAVSLLFTACNKSETTQEPASTQEVTVEADTGEASMEVAATEESAEMGEETTFTLEELAEYNGKNGASAYVAVNGVVYDVTGIDAWKDGEHKSGVVAGTDATEAIMQSPHGEQVLAELPVVGKLAQ